MRLILLPAALGIFGILDLAGSAVMAKPITCNNDDVRYVMQSGDTLITLSQKYLKKPSDYRSLQRYNRIADPRRIAIGRAVHIQRCLLKYQPGKAKLLSVRGQVLSASSASAPLVQAIAGQVLGEGATIRTAGSSFVTMQLDNGSRVSLPSNSDVSIRLLRKYDLGSSIDYDFEVRKGGARSTVTPITSQYGRYRVRTPKAVSAVRGTDFQARYDEAKHSDFAEVVDGALAVGIENQENIALPAGNGLALAQNGELYTGALLPPPELSDGGRRQADQDVVFALPSDPAVGSYRLTLSSDAGFIDQVADLIVNGGSASFSGIANGNYFLRVRAIATNGIQGLPVTYAFKRRLNSISAAAEQGDDGYTFKWVGDGEGINRYHFQLLRGSIQGTAIVDETGLTSNVISISDLPPGDYFWRVASVQYLDNDVAANWTSFEKLSIGAISNQVESPDG